MLYESMLLIGVAFVGFLVPHIIVGMITGTLLPRPLLVLHIVALIAAYFLWHWHRRGQTLAMQTWKIKLVTAVGSKPKWRQLILRFVFAVPGVLSGLGILWALFDRERQFLHDRLAGTRLIRL